MPRLGGVCHFPLLIVAIGFDLVARLAISKPEIISQTVEQLRANPEIKRAIGSYVGFGYNEIELSQIKELPAHMAFTMYGNEAEISLSVLIDSSEQVFEIKEYRIDSLIKK
ncbi:hypothetical protein KZP23_14660 [Echinicola marina]|uniref:hypothetical protein n=1 Tax=Echinicola marina TaxID=2859768 RepID=UPI001CF68443|nr:hypothetical protein [Echinicola marina]UCS91961.1 hypothetical protein KZP23_14660 [Echinicola marina]